MNRWIPLSLISLTALLLSLFTVWTNDAVAYQYFSPVFDEFHARPINTLADVWNSQLDHYMTTNGRFVVHLFVQLFCGLLGKPIFACANALCWFLLLFAIFRFIEFNKLRTLYEWFAVAAVWLSFLILPFDPPFQINYVWVGAALLFWLRYFLSKSEFGNSWSAVSACVLSVICGSLHEGFSIPIFCGIVVWMLLKRYRQLHVSVAQIAMSLSFLAGILTTALAPGNFSRIAETVSYYTNQGLLSYILFIEEGFPVWIFILTLALILWFARRNKSHAPLSPFERSAILIFGVAALASLGMCCVMLHLGRVAIPCMLFMTMIAIIVVAKRSAPVWLCVAVIVVACFLTCVKVVRQNQLNELTEYITRQYHASPDGIIYDKAGRIIANKDEITGFKWVYTKRERLGNPSKPLLIVRPEVMRSPAFERDTNFSVQLDEQAWLLVQSKTNPRDFFIDKTFLPGILNKQMAPRKLEFINNDEIVFDSIGPRRVALYINKRPYVRSSVRMSDE